MATFRVNFNVLQKKKYSKCINEEESYRLNTLLYANTKRKTILI